MFRTLPFTSLDEQRTPDQQCVSLTSGRCVLILRRACVKPVLSAMVWPIEGFR